MDEGLRITAGPAAKVLAPEPAPGEVDAPTSADRLIRASLGRAVPPVSSFGARPRCAEH